ncbi:hypothetical protein HWX16_17100 [Ochrobactrum intermedium]|uniref:hypothetical protein n=1 Tax=Brucella intermedia TaxID=94625 RepID=UPI00159CAA3F|nr:hypothetical protein [Brucella intermedia]NVM42048.1 hypothetical protein [Brucella intermedia]
MAKAAKPTDDTKKVPAAEPVGGPLSNTPDSTSQNGGAVQGDASTTNISPATATNDGTGNPVGPVNDQKAADSEIDIDAIVAASVQAAKDAGFDFIAAVVEAYVAKHGKFGCNGIRITAKVEGIRRGGRRHNGTNEYPVTAFEPIQLNQILGDPDLVAELIELED